MSISNESDASSATYKITLKGDGVTIAKDIDAAIAAEVMALVVGGPSYGSATSTKPKATKPRSHRGSAKKSSESAAKTRAKKRSGSPGIVNDLELRPKGKQSFVDFAMEKKPDGHFEKQAVSLYWLRHIAGVATGISVDHVNTCYVAAEWPRPAALAGNMRLGATRTKWLDTSDRSNLILTTVGEDMVKHKLPRAQNKK